MDLTGIRFAIKGTAPYSQSVRVEVFDPKGKNESHDEWDERVWRKKAHVGPDGKSIVIPAHGIHQSMVLGAQKGRLKPTAAASAKEGLANRLLTGIMLLGDAETNVTIDDAHMVAIQAHSNGDREAKKSTRVTRRFPAWNEWSATFDVVLVDDTLTAEDVTAALKWAGLVAGIGRFRPARGGHNGRFVVEKAESFDASAALAA